MKKYILTTLTCFILAIIFDAMMDVIMFNPYDNIFFNAQFWQSHNGPWILIFKWDAWHLFKIAKWSVIAAGMMAPFVKIYRINWKHVIIIALFLGYINLIFHELFLKELLR